MSLTPGGFPFEACLRCLSSLQPTTIICSDQGAFEGRSVSGRKGVARAWAQTPGQNLSAHCAKNAHHTLSLAPDKS